MKPISLFLLVWFACWGISAADKKVVFCAGSTSHGPREHEFRAGCLLLAKCLEGVPGITTVVASNGWPADVRVFDGASAVILYADGGSGHPAIRPERLKLLNSLADQGVGIGAMHYGVEVPAGEPGFAMLNWTGGYFEMFWSVNPTWHATFPTLADHPITRGVKPFTINDEWYYHMRFAPNMEGVTPILSTVPPKQTLDRPNGPHSGNPFVRAAVRRGEAQHLMWAFERKTGGRGFGFTGGHYHKNWAQDDFRKLALNAILWISNAEIPEAGVVSSVTPDDLDRNLDIKRR
jgi:type 1 glutamine amidotransferase